MYVVPDSLLQSDRITESLKEKGDVLGRIVGGSRKSREGRRRVRSPAVARLPQARAQCSGCAAGA